MFKKRLDERLGRGIDGKLIERIKVNNNKKINQILYYVGFGKDKWKNIRLFLHCYFKKYKVCVFQPGIPQEVDRLITRFRALKRYRDSNVSVSAVILGDLGGDYYEASKKAIELTERYWEQDPLPEKKVSFLLDKRFLSKKSSYFLKRLIAEEIFLIVSNLYQYKALEKAGSKILIAGTPIARFVVSHALIIKGGAGKCQLVKISSGINKIFLYYLAFLKDVFIDRGFVICRKKKKFKFAKEAVLGFSRPTLRDDLLIDDEMFAKKDILFLLIHLNDSQRHFVFNEAIEKGYEVECLKKMPLNLTANLLGVFCFYLFSPLRLLTFALLLRNPSLIFYGTFFLRRAFFFEVFMSSYNVDFFISDTESEDIVSTIVLNKYGTKTVFYNWSDLTVSPWSCFAYAAHNIYFAWGSLQYELPYKLSGIDNVRYVGGTFKSAIESEKIKAKEIRELLGISQERKIVVFCDNSFSNQIFMTEKFYCSFVELMYDFAITHPEVAVILKPKNSRLSPGLVSEDKREKFLFIIGNLLNLKNFYEVDPLGCCLEKVIAVSDVLVNMSISTPAVLAIVSNKNSVCYDTTGNHDHPFAQGYQNKVVFSDKNEMFKKIDLILSGKENVFKEVSEELKEGMDAYRDTHAINRMRQYLNEMTIKENV